MAQQQPSPQQDQLVVPQIVQEQLQAINLKIPTKVISDTFLRIPL